MYMKLNVPKNTDHSEFHLKMIFAMGCHNIRKDIYAHLEKKGI